MTRKILLVGCGYVGQKVALRELAAGASVTAIVKSQESVRSLKNKGISASAFDFDNNHVAIAALKADYDVIYYFVPPQKNGNKDKRIQNFLALRGARLLKKFVLISTTGVYGDCAGEWIDEARKPKPVAARAQRRLSAEQQCADWAVATGVDLVILRVGGIYGAGKLPLQRLIRQDPVLEAASSPWSNRIYIKDLIEVCCRASSSQAKGIFNAVDGSPGTMTDYFFQVADFAGLGRPQELSMEDARQQLGQGIMSYMTESRRIKNDRLIKELGAECIRFPTLESGLADIKLGQ